MTKDREMLKKQVVKNAAELFLKQGYVNTSIKQIADSVHLGKGHLYYYFKKKEDIVVYLFRDIIEHIYSTINDSSLTEDNSPFLRYAVSELIFVNMLATLHLVFRIHVEVTRIYTVKVEYIKIVNDFFKNNFKENIDSFTDKDLLLSATASMAAETDLLAQYYAGNREVSLNEIALTAVKIRLLLLGADSADIAQTTENALKAYELVNMKSVISKIVAMVK